MTRKETLGHPEVCNASYHWQVAVINIGLQPAVLLSNFPPAAAGDDNLL